MTYTRRCCPNWWLISRLSRAFAWLINVPNKAQASSESKLALYHSRNSWSLKHIGVSTICLMSCSVWSLDNSLSEKYSDSRKDYSARKLSIRLKRSELSHHDRFALRASRFKDVIEDEQSTVKTRSASSRSFVKEDKSNYVRCGPISMI